MAKLTRKNLKVFAQNSSESGQFGSARIGTKVLSDDPDVIQGLPAWGQGWNDATSAGQEPPTLEEFQGVQYVHSYQTAYILQEGIPEYSAETEYYNFSLVKNPGSVRIYRSLTDNNIGNPLNDSNNWRFVCDFNTVQPQNNYEATVDPTVNDDVTLGYSAGSYWYNTVSEETFFCVNADTGAAVWVLQSSIDPSDLGVLAFADDASQVPALDPNGTGSLYVQGQLDIHGEVINGDYTGYDVLTSGDVHTKMLEGKPFIIQGSAAGFTNAPKTYDSSIVGLIQPKTISANLTVFEYVPFGVADMGLNQWIRRDNSVDNWTIWLPQNDLPSDRTTTLTAPSSGSTVEALHDGRMMAYTSGNTDFVQLYNASKGYGGSAVGGSGTGFEPVVCVEVNKGDLVRVRYTSGASIVIRNSKSNRTI